MVGCWKFVVFKSRVHRIWLRKFRSRVKGRLKSWVIGSVKVINTWVDTYRLAFKSGLKIILFETLPLLVFLNLFSGNLINWELWLMVFSRITWPIEKLFRNGDYGSFLREKSISKSSFDLLRFFFQSTF